MNLPPNPVPDRPQGYRRDGSGWNRPSTTGPKRVHLDRGEATAVCSTRILLDADKPVDLLALPYDDVLCRRCFPRAGLRQPLAFVILGDQMDALMGQGYTDSIITQTDETPDCACDPDDPCLCFPELADQPGKWAVRPDAVYVEQVRALGQPRFPLSVVRT